MTHYYDLYGFVQDDLEQVRTELEATLGINFAPHDSMYRGGLYYRYDQSRSESLELQNNYNPEEEAHTEEQFSEYPVLLYVNEPSDPFEIERKLLRDLPSIRLLRRKIL